MADGSRHGLRYIEESTYGTTPATPAFNTLRHTSCTLALSKNSSQSAEIRDDRQISDLRHGAKQVGGDIGFELSATTFDDLIEAVMGGTWATNVLKAGTTRRSFTFERYFADIAGIDKPFHRFTGCEINTMNLSVQPDARITGTIGVIGQDMQTDTAIITGATYGAATTTAGLDSFTGTLSEGGSQIGVVTEISLDINNGQSSRFVVGSEISARPSIGQSVITGQIGVFFENSDLLDKFINETESSISFTLPDAAGNSLTFLLPRVKYNGGQPDVSGPGDIILTMPFQALYDATEQTNLKITRVTV